MSPEVQGFPGTAGRAPLVSIVTPTYRRPEMLRQALDSAVAQEFADFEVIVSDNDCSEEVEKLVASYDDPRLRYRTNGENVGALANALAALRAARGRYVALLHDDDAWEPRFLTEMVAPLEADPTLALAYCDHWIMDSDGARDLVSTDLVTQLWGRDRMEPGVHRPFVTEALVDRGVPIAMGSLIRRDAVDWYEMPEQIGTIYDIWIAYLASRDGAGAYYVPRRLTNYRTHPGAITSTTRYDEQFVFCYSTFLADPRLTAYRGELRRAAAVFETGLALALLRKGAGRGEARRLLARSLSVTRSPRAAAGLALTFLPVRAMTSARQWMERSRRPTMVRA